MLSVRITVNYNENVGRETSVSCYTVHTVHRVAYKVAKILILKKGI